MVGRALGRRVLNLGALGGGRKAHGRQACHHARGGRRSSADARRDQFRDRADSRQLGEATGRADPGAAGPARCACLCHGLCRLRRYA